MTPTQEIDYILHECFLAVGQTIGLEVTLEFDAVVWWHTRYRRAFLQAMEHGNSWVRDRRRVTAVGRFLGQRALHHAAGGRAIDVRAAALASLDIEAACQMNAEREGVYEQRQPGVLSGHTPETCVTLSRPGRIQ